MPTSGTHITIVQRLALADEFAELVGSPTADPDSDEGKAHKFAKLGAIGPDIFYAMLDYGQPLQDLANFLTTFAGSLECMQSLMHDIDTKFAEFESDATLGASDIIRDALGQFSSTFGMVGKVFTNVLLAELVDHGANFWPVFEARRQQDQPRTAWFWADYLHYVRSGVFVRELFEGARGNANHEAFAYGYLSHYVTDVVGHPFVNQVTGSVWRLYWQRHHLIENFIDAYVWPRWHDQHPDQIDLATGEQVLDSVRDAANANVSDGAPFTFARLNDHINIGVAPAADPLDAYIRSICEMIRNDLASIHLVPPVPTTPEDADLRAWAEFMSATFRRAYPASALPPRNLAGDGYPTPDDVIQAYSLMRLFLRLSTEESMREPEFPDIVGDVWKKVQDLYDHVVTNMAHLPPPPSPGSSWQDGFSLSAVWETILAYAKWGVELAIALGQAAIQFLRDAIAIGGVLLVDSIKAGLYLIKKALFDIYKHFRFVLVRSAYSVPYTDELTEELAAGIRAETLWRVPVADGLASFPIEELPTLERAKFNSSYVPWAPPNLLPQMREPNPVLYERPMTWVGPYGGRDTPEAFIDRPLGARTMLSPSGLADMQDLPEHGGGFRVPEDFGGAVPNCEVAFRSVRDALAVGPLPHDLLPDYNLDGDRGYGWPCWNLTEPPGESGNPDHLEPADGKEVTVVAAAIH